jgi:uncharacterized protein YggT (Ycf19 family)
MQQNHAQTEKTLFRVTSYIWYAYSAVATILALRFGLMLLGANPGAAFTQFIYNLSDVFVAPFQFVFPSERIAESTIDLSTLLAIVIYWLIAWGIVKLLLINRPVDEHTARRELEAEGRA